MKSKLTLSLDRSLIEAIKDYAEKRGKSVSQITSEYFAALTQKHEAPTGGPGRPGRDRPLPPVVQDLIGAAEGTEEDYYRYLEEKYR